MGVGEGERGVKGFLGGGKGGVGWGLGLYGEGKEGFGGEGGRRVLFTLNSFNSCSELDSVLFSVASLSAKAFEHN